MAEPLGFLSLPPEIRDVVYRHLFTNRAIAGVLAAFENNLSPAPTRLEVKGTYGIRASCRTTYSECALLRRRPDVYFLTSARQWTGDSTPRRRLQKTSRSKHQLANDASVPEALRCSRRSLRAKVELLSLTVPTSPLMPDEPDKGYNSYYAKSLAELFPNLTQVALHYDQLPAFPSSCALYPLGSPSENLHNYADFAPAASFVFDCAYYLEQLQRVVLLQTWEGRHEDAVAMEPDERRADARRVMMPAWQKRGLERQISFRANRLNDDDYYPRYSGSNPKEWELYRYTSSKEGTAGMLKIPCTSAKWKKWAGIRRSNLPDKESGLESHLHVVIGTPSEVKNILALPWEKTCPMTLGGAGCAKCEERDGQR